MPISVNDAIALEPPDGFLPALSQACAGVPVAVVIPAFQEAATIAEVIHRARAVLPGAAILVVDDGSTDDTASRAAAAGAEVVGGGINQGKGPALRRGMAEAMARGAEWIITLDGDGQHRPEDIPRLLERAATGLIVIGSRRGSSAGQPAARRFANRFADFWISWAARHPVQDSQCGLRAYPAAALKDLGRYEGRSGRFVFESEILIDASRAGWRTEAVEVEVAYGEALRRPSHFKPVADISRIVIMVAGKLLARGMDPVGLLQGLGWRR